MHYKIKLKKVHDNIVKASVTLEGENYGVLNTILELVTLFQKRMS